MVFDAGILAAGDEARAHAVLHGQRRGAVDADDRAVAGDAVIGLVSVQGMAVQVEGEGPALADQKREVASPARPVSVQGDGRAVLRRIDLTLQVIPVGMGDAGAAGGILDHHRALVDREEPGIILGGMDVHERIGLVPLGDADLRTFVQMPEQAHLLLFGQKDIPAGARRVVLDHERAADFKRAGRKNVFLIDTAALAGRRVAGDAAAIQFQRRAANVDAAAVDTRRVAGDTAAVHLCRTAPQTDAAAVGGLIARDLAAGHGQCAVGVDAAAVGAGGIVCDHAVIDGQRAVFAVEYAAAAVFRRVAVNFAAGQRGDAAQVVAEAARVPAGGVLDDMHVLQRHIFGSAVVHAGAARARVEQDHAARQFQRALHAAVNAAAALAGRVAADRAVLHLEGAVGVHAAAPLGLVAADGAALEDARGTFGDVDAAAAGGVAALDHAAAPAVGDRQGRLPLDLDNVAVAVRLGAVAVQRVAVQIEGDGLAVHLDPVPAVLLAGDVRAKLDRLSARGVLHRLLQAVPVGDCDGAARGERRERDAGE